MNKKDMKNYIADVSAIVAKLTEYANTWSRMFNPVREAEAQGDAKTLAASIMNVIDFNDWSAVRDDAIFLGMNCGTMVSTDDNSTRAVVASDTSKRIKEYLDVVVSRATNITVLYNNNQIPVWNDALLITLAMHMSRQGCNIKKCEILDGTAPYGLVLDDIVVVFQDVSEGVFKTIPIELCPMQLRASDKYNLAIFISHAMTLAQTDGRGGI